MQSKEFQNIIDIVTNPMIISLGLMSWDITYELVSKDSRKAKMLHLEDTMGSVYFSSRKKEAHIIYMYNNHKKVKQAVDTIIHELLHISMKELRIDLLPSRLDKVRQKEERTVKILTKLIMSLL